MCKFKCEGLQRAEAQGDGARRRQNDVIQRHGSGHPTKTGSRAIAYRSCLCSISEVPEWLRYNPYILGSYRPPLSIWQGTLSLFQMHNESGNVWSHLLPGLLFTFLSVNHFRQGTPLWPAISLGCAAMATAMWCSVGYHLYMPCCRSQTEYCALLKLDVVAIILALAVSQFVTLVYGYPCLETTIQQTLTAGFYAVAVLAMVGSFSLQSIKGRAALSGAFCLLRFATSFFIYGAKAFHFDWYTAAGWHALAYTLTFLGGYVNAARIPERVKPGCFDLWFNSHQLMHVLMSLAMLCTYSGIRADTVDFATAQC